MAVKKKGEESIPWVAIILLFIFGLWPIALVILFLKLFGKGKKNVWQMPPLTAEASAPAPKTGKTREAVQRVTRSPMPKASTARIMMVVGVLLIIGGLTCCWEPIDMMIWLGEIDSYEMQELMTYLAVTAAGGALLGKGISMDKSLKRFARYLVVMGDRDAISVEELARTLGFPEKQVEKDLQKMIEKNYFGGRAYLNMELGYLLRSGRVDEVLKQQQAAARAAAEKAEQPAAAETGYSGILREIRRANDEIADPVLSAKIDRLEQVAARIFLVVEQEPEKAERISTFFNYYLPTTQKLLDSYAKFESAGIEGENLRQAKARIESTMDTIVRGFEYQLDQLYQGDALDVDRDIRVMESMLNRDTASVERDFGLSGQDKVQ